MRPNPIPTPADGETDMFRNRLDNMIDMRHELVRLAGLIDWKRFDESTSWPSSRITVTPATCSRRCKNPNTSRRKSTPRCGGI
jgi:hypothetical protein